MEELKKERQLTLYGKVSTFVLGMQNKWYVQERERERERKKRNMAALTLQFKIRYSLIWGEFVRVVYANFFEASISAKHKNGTHKRQ